MSAHSHNYVSLLAFSDFFGMTCHWIDPDTLIDHTRVLTCRPLAAQNTAEGLATTINSIHAEFGISDKVSSLTVDNTCQLASLSPFG